MTIIDPEAEHLIRSSMYPRAGQNAPAGVLMSVAEYLSMSDQEQLKAGPLLYWLLGSGTPPYKMPNEVALYTDETPFPRLRCDNCTFAFIHVVSNTAICSQLRDPIKAAGWCSLWKP